MDTHDPYVLYEVYDRVAYIKINRPERANALNTETRRRLIEIFSEANANTEVWAVVITGAGERAFCAGGDMKEMNQVSSETENSLPPPPMTGPERNLYETLLELYKPTIAALNGPALAGGCELALACDIRIAADHASMGMPEAKRGMGANFATVLLPRLIPRAVAMEMLYTGEPISAEESRRWGLVNRVVPADSLDEEVERFARKLMENAPLTLRRYKHMLTKGWELPPATALRLDVGPNPYLSEDRKEGTRAFVEKRSPAWQAR